MGELAADSETRDFQDRPVVNPAAAGRKSERLSREICYFAIGAMPVVMQADEVTEVSRGHSRA